uniref:Uncharacterized protein n=1 Tax=Oryza barthii TaxID=65489 RepID=A0A0D3H5D2_9ORYZ
MLTQTKCRQCDRLDALGPARAAMTPRQRTYSIDDRSSRLQWRLGDVRPSDLAASAAISVPRIVPGEPHPALDVQAMRAACASCARTIYLKTGRLEEAVGGNGDTARAGNLRMVCHLVTLAGEEATGDGYEAARRQNARGAGRRRCTRRYDMVELLMWMDPQLARFPDQGTSPMYLAVSLKRESIAQLLYCKSGGNLSWSGPEGKNVLHAELLFFETAKNRVV